MEYVFNYEYHKKVEKIFFIKRNRQHLFLVNTM